MGRDDDSLGVAVLSLNDAISLEAQVLCSISYCKVVGEGRFGRKSTWLVGIGLVFVEFELGSPNS